MVAEIALFASYRGHDARFHWFTHFFVGASAALVVMAAVAAVRRRPVPLPLVWVLVAHLVAMAPDFAFVAGEAHQWWMDAFLGHISSHFVSAAGDRSPASRSPEHAVAPAALVDAVLAAVGV